MSTPVPVRALEFGLARRVQPSRPASACSISILRLNLVLTHEIPPDFRGGVLLFIYTAIRHRVSPEFIGSRNCVPMAFTAESPPAQGQQVVLKVVLVTGAAILQVTMDQLTCASLVPHLLLV